MNDLWFYGASDPNYGFLSNFYEADFVMSNQLWPTVEHYFQAAKFKDRRTVEAILQCSTPNRARHLGRTSKPLRSDWLDVRVDYMRSAVFWKFEQNPALKNKLTGTWGRKLIEHTWNDSFWGDIGDGHGQNMLGKILMEVREQFYFEQQELDHGAAARAA